VRKQTSKQKILNALQTKSMKPKDVAIATKLNIKSVYTTLYKLHEIGTIVKGDDGAYAIKLSKIKDGLDDEHIEKLTSKTIKKFKDTIEEQKAEIAKYHEWCLEWKKMVKEAEDKAEQLNAVLNRSFAVIHYLEERIEKLTIRTHNLSKE
jgi:Fe2+ or Zn2+ uptake regulation protein